MSANVDAMVREGSKALRAGNKAEARALLMKAVELDQFNEQAWLWLSASIDDPEEQKTCLENVLVINPNNERALQGLKVLASKTGGTTAPPSPAPNTSAGPFGDADDEMPTSLEWDMPAPETSSASAAPRSAELTPQDYDDWVSNLNLGTGNTGAPPAFSSGPFSADEEGDDLFGMDDEPTLPPSPPLNRPAVTMTTAPKAAPPASPMPPARSIMSPNPVESANDLLSKIEEDEDLDGFGDDEDDLFGDSDDDPSAAFSLIPDEIKATRLAGTDEKYPGFVPFGMVILIMLNLVAAGFLVFNLMNSGTG